MDEKRRVQIPAKWRPQKAGTELTLMLWPKAKEGPCLRVLPPAEMAKLMKSIDAMQNSDPNKVVLKRFIGSESVQVSVDKGGRICLPEEMARAACVHDFVSVLPEGYDTKVGERGVKLSVGEKQRISIARALLKNPPVLVLDEATASVDTATEQLIQQALQRLLKGRTSFVIAHRLSTVRRADRILVLENGTIADEGSHECLMGRTGTYRRLYDLQFEDIEATSETG